MLTISGHSDDVVSLKGDLEDEVAEGQRITVGGRAAGGVVVTMRYGTGRAAVWQASVRQMEESCPVPWPVRFAAAVNGYSTQVEIDCPPGTPVRCGKVRWLTCEGRVKP